MKKLLIRIIEKVKYFNRIITVPIISKKCRFRVHSKLEESLFRKHEENKLLLLLTEKLIADDVIYDIGAHAGYHSIFLASQLGKDGIVIAFEPNPNCYRFLVENISLNPELMIEPIQAAICDNTGTVKLSYGKAYERSARLDEDENWNIMDISSYTIDGFSRENKSPTILKIDVEGAENLVVTGAVETLKFGKIREILLEFHPALINGGMSTINEIRKQLYNYGYHECFYFERRDQFHILFEKKNK